MGEKGEEGVVWWNALRMSKLSATAGGGGDWVAPIGGRMWEEGEGDAKAVAVEELTR